MTITRTTVMTITVVMTTTIESSLRDAPSLRDEEGVARARANRAARLIGLSALAFVTRHDGEAPRIERADVGCLVRAHA